MSLIEIEYNDHIGWLCHDDLLLICDRDESLNDIESSFMDDHQLQSINRIRRRYIPKVDFNDEKLFPSRSHRTAARTRLLNLSTKEKNCDEELLSELNSMLACREYVSKQNHYFDRKQFQQAQAAQADEEKKFEEYQKRQHEQCKIERRQRRRQHPSYVSRFDEKRYVPSLRKQLSKFDR